MPTEEKVTRKLRAILSADVKGYSLLMADDEAFTVKTLKTYRALMSQRIEFHTGRVVDAPGDNLLAEFSSIVDAVECAVEIQEILKERNRDLSKDKRLEFRIGVNIGDVIQDGDSLYGEGVNIAARIEGLADAGGVCISRNAYDHIRNKLNYGYEYLGEHSVKNIKQPVRVYKLLMAPEDAGKLIGDVPKQTAKNWIWATVILSAVIIVAVSIQVYRDFSKPEFEPAKVEKMAHPLPEKPSIAVLAFDNLTGEPSQEYFSDGIAEEIITSLSKTDQLFVIARNSSFTYKGKPVNIKRVAEDLGVRYVLEGSVRKSDERLRITAQLIDAISGHHMWAERYDRDLKETFTLQDEITKKIVTALGVKLTTGEGLRVSAERTENIDYMLKNMKAWSHFQKGSLEDFRFARQLAEDLIKMEPENPTGYRTLGWSYYLLARGGISFKESIGKAYQMAHKAISLGEHDPGSFSLLCGVYLLKRQHENSVTAGKNAIAYGPNNAGAHLMLGVALSYIGKPDAAMDTVNKAIRLDPFPDYQYYATLGRCYLLKKQYLKAIEAYNMALHLAPGEVASLIGATASYSMASRDNEAREEAAKLIKIRPNFSLSLLSKISLFKDPRDLHPFYEGLRKAGIPEHPPLPLPDKPSIAVLAFDNLSGDPEQEYFADGISENIITALSKVSKLFVIARNSSFTYKGKPVRVQQIGQELGVRYVLEGSVQKSGDRVRITAQLIDSKNGEHLWAEKYDRDLKEFFALQDEITMEIINALQVELTEGEHARLWRKGTDNLEAYLKSLQARELYLKQTKENNAQAKRIAMEAIALDPDYPPPYHVLSTTHFYDVVLRTSKSPKESIKKSVESIQKAIALDDTYALAHGWLGCLYTMVLGEYDKGIMEAQKGVALDPNGAHNYLYLEVTLRFGGRHEEAVHAIEKAIRLNPFPPVTYYQHACMTYIFTKQYEKAITAGEQALKVSSPNDTITRTGLVAAYILAGKEEKARSIAEEILRISPKYSIQKGLKAARYKKSADADIIAGALAKAGLPE